MISTRIRVGKRIIALCAVLLLLPMMRVSANSTGPQRIVYDAQLLYSDGTVATTAHSVRFSWWTSVDYVAGDVTATGAIHAAASTYANWQEVHTVTPNSDGYFSVELGSGTALPDLSTYTPAELSSLHLQVEVKGSSAADTAYEILDQDTSNDAVDRSFIDSVPFALNADLLDQRDTGTASGSIPVLQSGGVLDTGAVPSGTNLDAFTIDADSSASGDISLTFGTSLSKKLTFEQDNSQFNFNDDVNVQGNLTVTGLINGVDLDNIVSSPSTHLKVSSGGGLTVNIAGGSYRINGAVTDYSGSGNVNISDQATNYLFFTSTGLTITNVGFPTDKSYIPLGTVAATGGAITGISDLRVLQSDDGERTLQKVLHPQYPNAAFQGDASSNVGQLYVTHDNISQNNYYLWTSTITSLQDYDVIVRVTVPPDFKEWPDNPINVSYRSTSSDAADNKMDITVFDTNGSPVTLSGSTTDLVNTSWTETNIEFTGTPTWTANQEYLIRFKMYAQGNYQMHLGALKIKHTELLPSN
jgi:hypothetical protein